MLVQGSQKKKVYFKVHFTLQDKRCDKVRLSVRPSLAKAGLSFMKLQPSGFQILNCTLLGGKMKGALVLITVLVFASMTESFSARWAKNRVKPFHHLKALNRLKTAVAQGRYILQKYSKKQYMNKHCEILVSYSDEERNCM